MEWGCKAFSRVKVRVRGTLGHPAQPPRWRVDFDGGAALIENIHIYLFIPSLQKLTGG